MTAKNLSLIGTTSRGKPRETSKRLGDDGGAGCVQSAQLAAS